MPGWTETNPKKTISIRGAAEELGMTITKFCALLRSDEGKAALGLIYVPPGWGTYEYVEHGSPCTEVATAWRDKFYKGMGVDSALLETSCYFVPMLRHTKQREKTQLSMSRSSPLFLLVQLVAIKTSPTSKRLARHAKQYGRNWRKKGKYLTETKVAGN